MGLDIRWPIGLMFSIIGAILVVYGLVTGSNAEVYKRSLDINVNFYWGLLLLVFGGAMLWMAIVAFTACFTLTILISLASRQTKTNEELKGLVYSLTPRVKSEDAPWYRRPATVGVLVMLAVILLNLIFW